MLTQHWLRKLSRQILSDKIFYWTILKLVSQGNKVAFFNRILMYSQNMRFLHFLIRTEAHDGQRFKGSTSEYSLRRVDYGLRICRRMSQ